MSRRIMDGEYPDARRSIASSPDPRQSTANPEEFRKAAR